MRRDSQTNPARVQDKEELPVRGSRMNTANVMVSARMKRVTGAA